MENEIARGSEGDKVGNDKVGGDKVGNDKVGNDQFITEAGDLAGPSVVGSKKVSQENVTGDKVNNSGANVYVNINSPQSEQAPSRGAIMPSVEQELRAEIKSLTIAVTKLESALERNSAVTAEQIRAIREQSQALERKIEERLAATKLVVPGQFPVWLAYGIFGLLAVIALGIMYGLVMATRGGF